MAEVPKPSGQGEGLARRHRPDHLHTWQLIRIYPQKGVVFLRYSVYRVLRCES